MAAARGGDGDPARYAAFLKRLASSEAEPLMSRTLSFVANFRHASLPADATASTHPDALAARALMEELEASAAAVWDMREAAEAAEVRRGLERYVMEQLHDEVVGHGADAIEDKVLHAQVATLSFVTPLHFGLPPTCLDEAGWEAAQRALLQMGRFRAPQDKIGCVVECVTQLSTIVEPCDGSFVRLFALAVLHARPEQFYSQLEYVARFVHPDALWSPESGGPFTIARAAVQYLAHLDPIGLGSPRATANLRPV